MRTSFIIGRDISMEVAQDLSAFLNESHKTEFRPDILDLYLRSVGGDLEAYETIKNMLERSEIPVHLHVTGGCHSAAFMLLYFTDNVYKSISKYSNAVVHTITTILEHRELLKARSYETVMAPEIAAWNNSMAESFKKHKALTPTEIKEFLLGEDIVLTYPRLYKAMLKCPHGNFLEEGEVLKVSE